jgi:PHP-associated
VMNHPNWEWHFTHFPQELMQDLQGAIGLEVYNGVIERLEGSAVASDRWDRLLSMGRWLWGFANDDSHKVEDVGIAWNVVQAQARTPDAILDALHEGRFYASTGVVINAVELDGRNICVRTANAQRIRFITRGGAIRASEDGADASWLLPDDPTIAKYWRYVRVECYGQGGRMAWVQPIKIQEVNG